MWSTIHHCITGGDGLSETEPLMLLESSQWMQVGTGVQVSGSLVQLSADGFAKVLLTNRHSLTHKIEEETEVGFAVPVKVVEPDEPEPQIKWQMDSSPQLPL